MYSTADSFFVLGTQSEFRNKPNHEQHQNGVVVVSLRKVIQMTDENPFEKIVTELQGYICSRILVWGGLMESSFWVYSEETKAWDVYFQDDLAS